MNLAHLHLILNHIPVVGVPLTLLILLWGELRKDAAVIRLGWLLLVVLAVITIPAFLTGEPAEEIVEHLPGVEKGLINTHEDHATLALIVTLAGGLFSLLALVFSSTRPLLHRFLRVTILVAALFSTAALLWTANAGGKIRHTEIRSGAAAVPTEKEDE